MKNGLWKTIVGMLTGNIVKDIGEAMDKNITTKEEKQQALTDYEKAYTERLKVVQQMTDPDIDSWLSKNVRPLCLLIVLFTLSVIMIFDIDVNQEVLQQYMRWTGIIVGFYFGARELVKVVKRKKNS